MYEPPSLWYNERSEKIQERSVVCVIIALIIKKKNIRGRDGSKQTRGTYPRLSIKNFPGFLSKTNSFLFVQLVVLFNHRYVLRVFYDPLRFHSNRFFFYDWDYCNKCYAMLLCFLGPLGAKLKTRISYIQNIIDRRILKRTTKKILRLNSVLVKEKRQRIDAGIRYSHLATEISTLVDVRDPTSQRPGKRRFSCAFKPFRLLHPYGLRSNKNRMEKFASHLRTNIDGTCYPTWEHINSKWKSISCKN